MSSLGNRGGSGSGGYGGGSGGSALSDLLRQFGNQGGSGGGNRGSGGLSDIFSGGSGSRDRYAGNDYDRRQPSGGRQDENPFLSSLTSYFGKLSHLNVDCNSDALNLILFLYNSCRSTGG